MCSGLYGVWCSVIVDIARGAGTEPTDQVVCFVVSQRQAMKSWVAPLPRGPVP
jgi:hypothetical protein